MEFLVDKFPAYRYELLIWFPSIIAFVAMLIVGGKQLASVPLTSPQPITVATLMSFGASLAATVISWSTLTPDYGVYHDRKAPAWRTFLYAYLGFFLASVRPCIPSHPRIESWLTNALILL